MPKQRVRPANNCFARWSREMQERHGVTAREIPDLLGMTSQGVWRYRVGEVVPPESVRRLMAALLDGARPRPYPLYSGARIESPAARESCGA